MKVYVIIESKSRTKVGQRGQKGTRTGLEKSFFVIVSQKELVGVSVYKYYVVYMLDIDENWNSWGIFVLAKEQ